MISRVPKEETLMERPFGDAYEAWAARTGPVSSTHSQRVSCKGVPTANTGWLEGTAGADTARVGG